MFHETKAELLVNISKDAQLHVKPEAEFFDVIGTKVLRVFLCIFTVTSTNDFTPPPPPPSESALKQVCNVNIVYGNLKSENSHDYAQKVH